MANKSNAELLADPKELWRIMRAAVDYARELTEADADARLMTITERDGNFTNQFVDNVEVNFCKFSLLLTIT